jgi:hypothetical protein
VFDSAERAPIAYETGPTSVETRVFVLAASAPASTTGESIHRPYNVAAFLLVCCSRSWLTLQQFFDPMMMIYPRTGILPPREWLCDSDHSPASESRMQCGWAK